ncbi:hypothetical protein [Paenisporosarcina sp. TG20]|uniref:hypothetical protein n=1 Tax=Paenisporosarcina sp. TG20 TaxID=1211706 RepID=UPI0002DDE82D|nr:hypothetical protein [Paenisporosarcina sp. TG20]
MPGNWHVPCGVGEKLAITSNAYLLLTKLKKGILKDKEVVISMTNKLAVIRASITRSIETSK